MRAMISVNDPMEAAPAEAPATPHDTRLALLARSKRDFAPIPKMFVQDPDRNKKDRSAPLAKFVNNGDLRGLQALLLLHAFISSGDGEDGWSTTLPIQVFARAFGITPGTASSAVASSGATKVLTRLEQKQLIARRRSGRERKVTVTLLRPDGSGGPYVRPERNYFKLPNAYWVKDWYRILDLPATAMLLVALHEKPGFELPTERMKAWYGWSPDTAQRGFRTLQEKGVLSISTRLRTEPLSPSGLTKVNVYRLLPPFKSTTSDRTGSTRGQK